MSLLFVSLEHDVSIMRNVAKFLFSHVIEPMAKTIDNSDFLDEAEAELLDENISFYRFNREQFNTAYKLIQEKRQDPILSPFADEILDKMQADPRYAA